MVLPLCKLEQYQSFVSLLKPLYSFEIHFKPEMIDVHMLNGSNDVWTSIQYKTPIINPCSICVDTNALTPVKGDVVDISIDGNNLLFKTGKLTHKAPKLVDPNIPKKNKESINVSWDHIVVTLTNADLKDIISMVDNKSKYDFILNEGVFTLKDISNDLVQFDMPIEGADPTLQYISRFHGNNLVDVLFNTKHFTGCNVIFGSKCPVEFVYKCEWLDVVYLVAPLIEQE